MIDQIRNIKRRDIYYQMEDTKKQIRKSRRLLERIFRKDLGFKTLFFEEILKMPDPEIFLSDFLRDYRVLKEEIKRALISKEFNFR